MQSFPCCRRLCGASCPASACRARCLCGPLQHGEVHSSNPVSSRKCAAATLSARRSAQQQPCQLGPRHHSLFPTTAHRAPPPVGRWTKGDYPAITESGEGQQSPRCRPSLPLALSEPLHQGDAGNPQIGGSVQTSIAAALIGRHACTWCHPSMRLRSFQNAWPSGFPTYRCSDGGVQGRQAALLHSHKLDVAVGRGGHQRHNHLRPAKKAGIEIVRREERFKGGTVRGE